MSRAYLHTHDADVDDAEYGEIVDAWEDTRPDRSELNDAGRGGAA